MKTYAVLSDSTVSNIIVAASLEIAESVTNSKCILVTEETKYPHIGLKYEDSVLNNQHKKKLQNKKHY